MTLTQEEPTEIFSDPSMHPLVLAQGSPSGLAWIANAKTSKGRTTSSWIHARHVDYLDEILVQLAARELKAQGYVGVIIEEPPRMGKSELTSHWFPTWYLGTFPDERVMFASYEADFAAEWGRKVRDSINRWGPEIFNVEVSNTSSAANRWNLKTPHKGGMSTAGVGGSFTGRGANLLLIDDPIKNAKEADSETIRNAHYSWYKTTARTRLEPNGIICLIMTRWHEDDLAGRLIRDMGEDPDADKFLVIRLPMVAEDPDEDYPEPDPLGRAAGELLWPDRYDLPEIKKFIALGPRTWNALYQQRPTPQEGALFQRDWFEVVQRHQVPHLRKIVRRWDIAATEEGEGYDPDYTVGAKIGLGKDGLFYIMDLIRFRETPGKTELKIKATAAADTMKVKIRMEQEPGASGKTVISHFRRKVLRGYAFRGVRSTGDKVLRAEIFASHAEQGDVKVVQGAWNAEFFREVIRFPNGSHDDQVDAVSGALDDLATKGAGTVVTW